jgi:hypothetical protein
MTVARPMFACSTHREVLSIGSRMTIFDVYIKSRDGTSRLPHATGSCSHLYHTPVWKVPAHQAGMTADCKSAVVVNLWFADCLRCASDSFSGSLHCPSLPFSASDGFIDDPNHDLTGSARNRIKSLRGTINAERSCQAPYRQLSDHQAVDLCRQDSLREDSGWASPHPTKRGRAPHWTESGARIRSPRAVEPERN